MTSSRVALGSNCFAILAVLALLALSSSALAQEVAYLDLTNTTPRVELRYPPAPPPKCDSHGCTSGGWGSGGVADLGVDSQDKHALTATLMWMDRIEYQEGASAQFEVRLQNTGEMSLSVPWTPDLADLQPADESATFSVHSLGLAVSLRLPGGYAGSIGDLTLYGSPCYPGSTLTLNPGESARVRGQVTLSLPHRDGILLPDSATSQHAFASCWYHKNTYHPHPGGMSVASAGVQVRLIGSGDVVVRIAPNRAIK